MMNSIKIAAFLCLLVFNIPVCHGEENPSAPPLLPIESAKIDNDIDLKVQDAVYKLTAPEISGWIVEKNDLIFRKNYSSELENIDICPQKKSISCSLLASAQDQYHIQKTSSFFLDAASVEKYIETLAQKTDKDPVNASLEMKDGKISAFSLNQKGIALDKKIGASLLEKYIVEKNNAGSLNLPYEEKEPEISMNSIDNLGITEFIGEGRSNFRGSPKNRIFNINVALKRFNGTLINPGEEFSFVKTLGQVDGEHGYLPELVIKKDKTEPEFGGGICQVSTTAFRAAINSGLPITARRNHAYPVSYYNPQGMDSTVYVPKPDLRFINNTPAHILIQAEIIGTELIFRFFGTSDGRKVAIDGPRITERNPDGSMKTTFTQKVSDANGNIIREDVFNSSYDSPNNYPHPGSLLTEKPKDWSKNEWTKYLKENKKT